MNYLYKKNKLGKFEPVSIEFGTALSPGIYYVKKEKNLRSIYNLTYFFDNQITNESDLKEKILTIDLAEIISENFSKILTIDGNKSIFEKSVMLADAIVKKIINTSWDTTWDETLENNNWTKTELNLLIDWKLFLEKNKIKYFNFRFNSDYNLTINLNMKTIEVVGPSFRLNFELLDDETIGFSQIVNVMSMFINNLILIFLKNNKDLNNE